MTTINKELLIGEHLRIADLFGDWRCVAEGWTAMESKVWLGVDTSYNLITEVQSDGTLIHKLELTGLFGIA